MRRVFVGAAPISSFAHAVAVVAARSSSAPSRRRRASVAAASFAGSSRWRCPARRAPTAAARTKLRERRRRGMLPETGAIGCPPGNMAQEQAIRRCPSSCAAGVGVSAWASAPSGQRRRRPRRARAGGGRRRRRRRGRPSSPATAGVDASGPDMPAPPMASVVATRPRPALPSLPRSLHPTDDRPHHHRPAGASTAAIARSVNARPSSPPGKHPSREPGACARRRQHGRPTST